MRINIQIQCPVRLTSLLSFVCVSSSVVLFCVLLDVVVEQFKECPKSARSTAQACSTLRSTPWPTMTKNPTSQGHNKGMYMYLSSASVSSPKNSIYFLFLGGSAPPRPPASEIKGTFHQIQQE